MTSYTILIAAVILLSRVQLFPTAQGLPVPGGSGMDTEPLTPATIDCTATTASTTTPLEALRAGLRALGDYAATKHSDLRVSSLQPCGHILHEFG